MVNSLGVVGGSHRQPFARSGSPMQQTHSIEQGLNGKHMGARRGNLGGNLHSQNVGNSILGRPSTKVAQAPGGISQVTFG